MSQFGLCLFVAIGIYISAVTSSNLDFNEAYYDLEIYSGSGANEYVVRLLEGKVKLSKGHSHHFALYLVLKLL